MKRIYSLALLLVLGVLLFPLHWVSTSASLAPTGLSMIAEGQRPPSLPPAAFNRSGSWLRQALAQPAQDAPMRLIPLDELDSLPFSQAEQDPRRRDPRLWTTRLQENNLRQADLFPGVDLVFAGDKQKLEAVLLVKPGADPAAIHFDFPQAEFVSADAQGNVWVGSPAGDVGLLRPQLLGQSRAVKGEFVAAGARVVLRVVGHNEAEPLLVRFDVLFPARPVNLIDQILFRVMKAVEQTANTPSNPMPIIAAAKSVDKATANPGETLTYTVTISNTGDAPATGLTFTDMLDANTTLVPGSLKAAPLAVNDAYNVYGNVSITIPDGALDLLSNDVDPDGGALTATAETKSSAQCSGCNNVTINADGSFTYDPPVGYTGSDSFSYTVSDPGNNTDTGTVNLTISGMLWFVNNGASACTMLANQCGKLSKPFSTLPAFQAVNDNMTGMRHPGNGQDIFIYQSGTAYTGPLSLLMGQRLIGQDATPHNTAINNSALLNLSLPTGSATLPSTDTGGATAAITTSGVTVASGNTLRGLTVTNTGANTKLAGMAFGALTIGDVGLTGTGKALDLTNGTLALPGGVANNLTTLESTSSGTQGVDLDTVAGSLTVGSGGTQISNSTNEGILLTGCAANINFGGGSIASVSGTSFSVSGGTVTTTYSGNITKNNAGTMVSVTGGHMTGALTFQTGTLSATTASTGNGLQFNNADGTYNFNGTTTLNGGDAGIDILNGSSGTFSFSSNTTINNPSGSAYNEDTSTANVTYNGTITQNNANNAVNINAKTGGTTSFTGAITASTTTANAIDLTNTGGTVNFSGGLSLTTTSGVGFNATGSGATVSATQNNTTIVNTISSTTGTALNVTNTNIGLNGLTFRTISANGGTNGIVLSNTGTTAGVHGGLIVTGTDGADADTLPDTGTGGTIQNTTGDSISLNSTRDVSLGGMNITNSGNNNSENDNSNWIDATSVVGHTLQNVNCNDSVGHGLNGNSMRNLVVTGGSFLGGGIDNVVVFDPMASVGDAQYHGFNITNLLGTSSITSATFERSNTVQCRINNNTATNFAGTPDTLTVSSSTWQNQAVSPFHGDHLSVSTDTGGNFRLIVNNSAGPNNVCKTGGTCVQAGASGTNSKMDADISGVTSGGNTGGPTPTFNSDTNTAMAVIVQTGGGSVTYDILNNTSLGTGSLAIAVTHTGTGTSSGTIGPNTITHVAGTGTDGLQIVLEGNGTATANISNNSISGDFQRGMNIRSGLGTGTLNLTLDNNNLHGTGNGGLQVVNIQTGSSGSGSGNTLCLNMLNNDVTFGPGASYTAAYRLINGVSSGSCTLPGGCHFRLQDFGGNGASTTDVANWVTNPPKSNTTGGGAVTVTINSNAFAASMGNCATPMMMAPIETDENFKAAPPSRNMSQLFEQWLAPQWEWAKYFPASSQSCSASAGTAPIPIRMKKTTQMSGLIFPLFAAFVNNHIPLNQPAQRVPSASLVTEPSTAVVMSELSGRTNAVTGVIGQAASALQRVAAPKMSWTGYLDSTVSYSTAISPQLRAVRQLWRPVLAAFTAPRNYFNPLAWFEQPAAAAEQPTVKPAAVTQAQPPLKLAPQDRPTRIAQERRPTPERQEQRPPLRVFHSLAGQMLSVGPFTLPAGESAVIMFQVTVNNPFPAGLSSVSNQGRVTADGGVDILTDDPNVGVAANPTVTNINVPDLIATKTNNVSGTRPLGSPSWIWTTTLANQGNGTASFAADAVVFRDNLPNSNISYSNVNTSGASGITGTLSCNVSSNDLICTASGGPVTINAGGSINVNVTATATAAGAFVNPRSGGQCEVDPTPPTNGTVNEGIEANNTCGPNTVNVFAPPTLVKAFGGSASATIAPGGVTTMSFTFTNPAANPGNLTGVGFTAADTLTGFQIAGTPNLSNNGNCGSLMTTGFTSGSTSVNISGATVTTANPCVVTVNVTSSTPGSYTNSATPTSTQGGTGVVSNTATLIVATPSPH